MAEHEIDDERIAAVCRVLLDHNVVFIVIGGVAARLHDTGHATVDIDICPSGGDDNLERLGEALRSIDARLRVEGEPAGIPFDPHPRQRRQLSMKRRPDREIAGSSAQPIRVGSVLVREAGGVCP